MARQRLKGRSGSRSLFREGHQQGVEGGFNAGPAGLVEGDATDAGASAAAEGQVLDGGQKHGVDRHRIAGRAHAELVRTLDATPPAGAETLRAFARESLSAWLGALRASPLTLRLMAWALVEATPLLNRIEAERAAVLQAWMRERRPRLRLPPSGDAVAINAVLLAAVQHLALSGGARPGVGGVALDEAGWARIEAALDTLLAAFPD